MTMYDKFKALNLNFSLLGLGQGDTNGGYFCTPVGAEVIGWEGVDGIHYCFVKDFGETVFAVNPMNPAGKNVHPLARTFEDFLRLVLACGSATAVEQTWMWNRGEFDAYLETYPPDAEQQTVLDALRDKLCITPMEDPYRYIKTVQSAFDYSTIPFSQEYYDLSPDEPETQEPPERPEWEVYFDNGFGRYFGHDRPGQEISVNKTFTWGGRTWYIPAVYACGKGLVVDFCVEINPAAHMAFLEKWKPWMEGKEFTPEELDQWTAENPSRIDFAPKATVNGKELCRCSGSGSGWIPMSICMEYEQAELNQQDWESIWLMEHYGLDAEKGWVFWRQSFSWVTMTKPKVKTLSLSLEMEKQSVPGPRFTVSGVGDTVPFTHPVTGETHILQVVEYENQEMDMPRLPDAENWEYPTHCTAMSYVVEPELPRESLTVRDCGRGDSPKVKFNPALEAIGGEDGPTAACSIGIIGGMDGPIAIVLANGKTGHPRIVCSALRFEQPEQIEWRMVFYHKAVEDMEIDLPLLQE
jgi:hypothetical protein